MYLFFAELFEGICQKCVAVLCCRMSPLQKAQVSCVNNSDNDEDRHLPFFFNLSITRKFSVHECLQRRDRLGKKVHERF